MIFLPHLGLASGFTPCEENALEYINRNFQILDAIVQMSAIAIVDERPDDPDVGVYLLPTSVDVWSGTSWLSIPAKPGFLGYVESEESFYNWTDDEGWVEFSGGGSGAGVVQVPDIAARDAIPAEDRKEGMLVYVINGAGGTPETYQLQGGIDNADYVRVFIPYSSAAVPNTAALRTVSGAVRGSTAADDDPLANGDDLINRAYLTVNYKKDKFGTQTLANAATYNFNPALDLVSFEGTGISTYTIALESNLAVIRRITLKFNASIQTLTITPGTHNPPTNTPNTIDWYPKMIKAGDCLQLQFNFVTFRWEVTAFFSATPLSVRNAVQTFVLGTPPVFSDMPEERILGKGSAGGGTVIEFPDGTRDGQVKFFVGTDDSDTFVIEPQINIKLNPGARIEHYRGTTSSWAWIQDLGIWVLKSMGVV